jgi:carboxyl-terminal processing protease
MKLIRALVCLPLLCALASSSVVTAQEVSADSLLDRASEAYTKKEYEQSARLYAEAISRGAREVADFYNAARSAALAGRKDEAFGYLARAVAGGYANTEQFKQDVDLAGLRADPRWQPLVEKSEANRRAQQTRWNSPALRTPYRENLSEDEKVAGLSKFWSEVKYNFANFDLVPDLDWDALYLAYLPKVRQTKSTQEYYLVLTELCARLKDGHTNVFTPSELSEENDAYPDVRTRLIEDRVFVILVTDEKLVQEGVRPGVEVLEINGLPVRQYAAERIRPYQSASTPQDLDVRTYEYGLLTGSSREPLEVVFRDADGRTFKKTLPRMTYRARMEREKQTSAKAPEKPPAGPRYIRFEVEPGNIGYLLLSSFEDRKIVEEFEAAFPQIAKTDALVLDIRGNGGGSGDVGHSILSYLTDKPFKTSQWKTRDYRPSYRAWGQPEGWFAKPAGEWRPKGEHLYSKPVILLTGPRTFSAAEDFAVAFDFMKRGLIVGEPTGGSTGQPLFFELPGGGSARVCTKRDTYPDGKEFVGVGVQPQLIVRRSIADFRAGRDTVLEVALAELRKMISKEAR